MGTTLTEALYYIPSTRILECIGLRFDINLHTYPEPVKFFTLLSGRSFCVDIKNSALRYYFRSILFIYFYFYLVYTSACNLVSIDFVRGFRKVDLRACEDRVKVNYFRLILSQRESQIDYAESTKKHKREI